MENAGAEVFSIIYNGQHQHPMANLPNTTFVIWAKIGSYYMIDIVDKAIKKEFKS